MDLQRLRCRRGKCLVIGLACCVGLTILLSLYPISDITGCVKVPSADLGLSCEQAKKACGLVQPSHQNAPQLHPVESPAHTDKGVNSDSAGDVHHKMALLVPFRDRLEELLEFAPYMFKFLNKQGISHRIYVLNQVDDFRFNRASLINVGFLESRSDCDYIAMHDVDLLPLNPDLSYGFPEAGPFHVSSPEFHPKYNYTKFVGGVLLMNRDNFIQVNGMSNRYWGWGREDDELYVRLLKASIKIRRPIGITTGKKDTFHHIHDAKKRVRDNKRYFNQTKKTSRMDRETGVGNVRYSVDSRTNIMIEGAPVTFINVRLKCDLEKTPWCLKPENQKNHVSELSAASAIINN